MEHPFRIAVAGVGGTLVCTAAAAGAVEGEPTATAIAGELGLVWLVVSAQVIAALVAIALGVERLVRGGRARVVPAALQADAMAKGGAGDWPGVLASAKEHPGPLADAIGFVVEHRFNDITHLQQASRAAVERAAERIAQRPAAIALAGWCGALLGLLATVLAMLAAFATAARFPGAVPAVPFAAALVPAALAIGLGLPVLVLHAVVEGRARGQALELAAAVDGLIDAWFLKPEGDARRRAQEEEAREREALRQAMRARAASAKGGVAAARGAR